MPPNIDSLVKLDTDRKIARAENLAHAYRWLHTPPLKRGPYPRLSDTVMAEAGRLTQAEYCRIDQALQGHTQAARERDRRS